MEKAKKAAVATCEPCEPSRLQRPIVIAISATRTKVSRSGPARKPNAACTNTPADTAPR